MPGASDKAAGAFRTIGELSRDTGLPQHILRYWETRFPQLRPLQRAGNRRYYRPDDIALVLRIHVMLNQEGYTIRGVQKQLAGERKQIAAVSVGTARTDHVANSGVIAAVRDRLVRALADDLA